MLEEQSRIQLYPRLPLDLLCQFQQTGRIHSHIHQVFFPADLLMGNLQKRSRFFLQIDVYSLFKAMPDVWTRDVARIRIRPDMGKIP